MLGTSEHRISLCSHYLCKQLNVNQYIPYSREYWQSFSLADSPEIVCNEILADFILAARYSIIYAQKKFWRNFNSPN